MSGRKKASETPHAKGIEMPAKEMATAGRPILRISPTSVSMPVRSNSSNTPNSAMPSSISFLRYALREDRLLHFRPDKAEKRWAEQDARDQVADHGGLAKALHRLAEQAGR